MGKKRNNAAKKKQAAAKKKRLSSAYGVSVQKGGTLARKNGVLDASPSAGGKAHAKKQSNAASASGAGANAISPAQQHNKVGIGAAREIPGKRPRDTVASENDEFRRLHASLEERSLALQARKAEQMRGKKQRKKQHKKGWGGKFAGPSATTTFAPATLTLGPKSTEELMDDAADCVAQGMNDIGQRADISADGAIATEGRSSLAAAASMSWKLRVSNVASEATQQQTKNKNNAFAALEEDSDSDNEWGETKSKPPVHPFQFQPASFTFQPAVSSSTTAVADDDLDPDL
ncbi:hypothetical protein ACHAXT_007077 [Thalassiosira profunda]